MNRYFCFHTDHYAELAQRCAQSFAQFGLEVELVAMASEKDWMANCMQRSTAMEVYADLHPNDGIGLLDADLTCLKDPILLREFGTGHSAYPFNQSSSCNCGAYDVAVHDLVDMGRMPDQKTGRYSAGVNCFAPTPLGRACLRLWASKCREDKLKGETPLREQVYLYDAIVESKATVFNLGVHYNTTAEERYEPDKTVILHHVASRQLRPVVGGGI